ncbi:hypothetical protein QE152_g26110 [Popillia japonica]|uniref:Reverse transcriptase domain-containing protein n=1 Tax=Popillia japonica TaxID=7064 RepID=A0AAW1K0J0_POPJA
MQTKKSNQTQHEIRKIYNRRIIISIISSINAQCKRKKTQIGYRNLERIQISGAGFADDIVLIAENKKSLQQNIDIWNKVLKSKGAVVHVWHDLLQYHLGLAWPSGENIEHMTAEFGIAECCSHRSRDTATPSATHRATTEFHLTVRVRLTAVGIRRWTTTGCNRSRPGNAEQTLIQKQTPSKYYSRY